MGLPSTPLLSAVGMHKPRINDMFYDTFGICVAEVEIDVLTAETKTLFAHVMFDSGKSMNPMIDLGQLEGAFMMGLGHQLLEGVDFDPATGKCLSHNTWTYKLPLACDIPETLYVDLVDMEKARLENPCNGLLMSTVGSVLACVEFPWKPSKISSAFKSSKAIGEPPLVLASAVHCALHEAVTNALQRPLPGHMLPIPANTKSLISLLFELHTDTNPTRENDAKNIKATHDAVPGPKPGAKQKAHKYGRHEKGVGKE